MNKETALKHLKLLSRKRGSRASLGEKGKGELCREERRKKAGETARKAVKSDERPREGGVIRERDVGVSLNNNDTIKKTPNAPGKKEKTRVRPMEERKKRCPR